MADLSPWQRPEDGFPSDAYFEAVAAALTEAGVPAYEWNREEDWEVNYRIDRDIVARGPLHCTARHGLYISWRCEETDNPLSADEHTPDGGFTGYGWYWVPYSKDDTALGDFAREFEELAYLAEPSAVAAAVWALVLGGHADA